MPTTKVSIAAFSFLIVMTSVFMTATALKDIMFPFIDTRGNVGAPEVAGVETEAGQEENTVPVVSEIAKISIEDNHDGTATVYLNLREFGRISALDLTFEALDGLVATDVVCADGYECTGVVIDQTGLRFIAFRSPDASGELWLGEMKVATIEYDPMTAGFFEINGMWSRVSWVVEYETGKNLLTKKPKTYRVGE